MKPAPFEYHTPGSLDEAAQLMTSLENAKLIAGGMSLGPMLNFRYVIVDHLVDLGGVAELAGISLENGCLRIGAMTRQRDIEFSDLVREQVPLLTEGLRHTGHRQTRNRGTIGGSLSHFDPSAEQPTVCAAHDAVLEIVSAARGRRRVPFAEFGRDFMTTAIEPDEILATIKIPVWPKGHGYGFHEFARRRGDFAVVACAALLQLGHDRTVERASITLAGVGSAPLRMREVEGLLTGRQLTPELVKKATKLAGDINPVEDAQATADYRRHLARVLSGRAIDDAAARAK